MFIMIMKLCYEIQYSGLIPSTVNFQSLFRDICRDCSFSCFQHLLFFSLPSCHLPFKTCHYAFFCFKSERCSTGDMKGKSLSSLIKTVLWKRQEGRIWKGLFKISLRLPMDFNFLKQIQCFRCATDRREEITHTYIHKYSHYPIHHKIRLCSWFNSPGLHKYY